MKLLCIAFLWQKKNRPILTSPFGHEMLRMHDNNQPPQSAASAIVDKDPCPKDKDEARYSDLAAFYFQCKEFHCV
jgi:hypothetical protein